MSRAFSELAYARQVAEKIGTEHHEVVIGRDDFFDALPQLIWHEDEPISWPSSVSLYFVSRLAAEQVKVVLTGEGSDELFGGYARYRIYILNQRLLKAYGAVPRLRARCAALQHRQLAACFPATSAGSCSIPFWAAAKILNRYISITSIPLFPAPSSNAC